MRIGTETAAAYRGRGFATLTIAERMGYRKVETYAVFVGSFGEADRE